jgi:hypothetical protein
MQIFFIFLQAAFISFFIAAVIWVINIALSFRKNKH